jgi:hypothetical protein
MTRENIYYFLTNEMKLSNLNDYYLYCVDYVFIRLSDEKLFAFYTNMQQSQHEFIDNDNKRINLIKFIKNKYLNLKNKYGYDQDDNNNDIECLFADNNICLEYLYKNLFYAECIIDKARELLAISPPSYQESIAHNSSISSSEVGINVSPALSHSSTSSIKVELHLAPQSSYSNTPSCMVESHLSPALSHSSTSSIKVKLHLAPPPPYSSILTASSAQPPLPRSFQKSVVGHSSASSSKVPTISTSIPLPRSSQKSIKRTYIDAVKNERKNTNQTQAR